MVDVSHCPDKMTQGHVWELWCLMWQGPRHCERWYLQQVGEAVEMGQKAERAAILHDFCIPYLLWVSNLTYKPNIIPFSSKFLLVIVFTIVTEKQMNPYSIINDDKYWWSSHIPDFVSNGIAAAHLTSQNTEAKFVSCKQGSLSFKRLLFWYALLFGCCVYEMKN